MKIAACSLAIALFVAIVSLTTNAQDMTPPTYCCNSDFTYCKARNHQHDIIIETHGRFANNGIVNSECNNGGNNFFGNTLRLHYWGRTDVFWYDWSTDPNAAVKLAVWGSTKYEPLTVQYCLTCKMAISAISPLVPYKNKYHIQQVPLVEGQQ